MKTSRLIPRRSVAQDFIRKGKVLINGSAGKSGRDVKQGDEIEIKRYSTTTLVRVLEVPRTKQFSKKEASGLYELVSETRIENDLFE